MDDAAASGDAGASDLEVDWGLGGCTLARECISGGLYKKTLARVSLLTHDLGMRAFTIKAAKAHLNELVESAEAGEQVVLMRGAKHVAAIVPIDESQLELAIDLTDVQAARLWRQLASEKEAGGTLVFSSAEKAVQHLSKPARRQRQSRV